VRVDRGKRKRDEKEKRWDWTGRRDREMRRRKGWERRGVEG
jgi:hypothetical protein